ncbi:ABC transporter ATP-binding protein [Breznakiella homolactica]|uniref:ATP-binding cassette domain-containing protein n=1 Tax=Breznakiella homolactica TaxID=2798577 RepID=A0A7T7XKD0_9SPIR|nr:ATP-binding cassette domain-containing protein [Breznakiella homolactica]QQO07961.1 ATP-binding cassette domain-containing protein [Breznakiella homolactica]
MIQVQGLTKYYGPVEAVRDVSFEAGTGQVLGFLGPNGAGKTTVMKILTGYHFPDRGEALIDGISVQDNPLEVKKRIGYLPESVPLYGDLNPEEYLTFVAASRLVPKAERKKTVERALEACGLMNARNKTVETLSKGYKQRVGLAQAIIHDPPILILDEPTSGLDPNQIIDIRNLIKELGRSKTVILSTHILQEVEAVCSQVLIINEGIIAAQGSPEEIAATMKGGDTWELQLKGKSPAEIEALAALLGEGLSSVSAKPLDRGITELTFLAAETNDVDGEAVFDWAVSQGLKILAMNRKRLSLEDIFVKLTGDEGGSHEA